MKRIQSARSKLYFINLAIIILFNLALILIIRNKEKENIKVIDIQNNLSLGRKRMSILKEKDLFENQTNPGNMIYSTIKNPGKFNLITNISFITKFKYRSL